jgi:uncharacterized protein
MGVEFRQNPGYLPPKKNEPALHRAARLGDGDSIRRLVAAGADVNLPFDMRLDPGARQALATPLMVAAGSGEGATAATMRLLLELGADPALSFEWGSIARYAAAGLGWNYAPGGDAARLQLCLELGCDPDETDKRGVTLLADAAGTGDGARVKVLLSAGAGPNAAVIAGASRPATFEGSPFDENGLFAFQIPLHNAVEADEVEIVSSLIAAGADVHAVDRGRRTALFGVRSLAVARRLVDAGLDIEARDCLAWPPLVAAIHDGSLEGVRALISAGADVNSTHDRGFSVFMSAVGSSERRLDVMEALLDAGADPHAVSDLGWNAFHAAIDVNGANANSEESVRSTFEFLSRLGVDINHKDARGATPLDRARSFGTGIEAEVLRRLGAK